MSLPQHLQFSNPHLVDHLRFMLEQESTHYRAYDDYLRVLAPPPAASRRPTGGDANVAVTPSDRRTMLLWSYDIADAGSLPREVAVIASSYFDRLMFTNSTRARAAFSSLREFQLAYVACLVVALKCREGVQADPGFVSEAMCEGLYGEEEIAAAEREVLGALGWRLNGPSPHEFVEGMAALLPSHLVASKAAKRIREIAQKRVEAAALEYPSALRDASSVAYEALMMAMWDVELAPAFGPLDRLRWMRNIAMVTGIGANDYDPCDGPFGTSCQPSTPSLGDGENGLYGNFMMCPNAPRSGMGSVDGYRSCSPAPDSDPSMWREGGYGELLMIPLSGSDSSDYSPVCAMPHGK